MVSLLACSLAHSPLSRPTPPHRRHLPPVVPHEESGVAEAAAAEGLAHEEDDGEGDADAPHHHVRDAEEGVFPAQEAGGGEHQRLLAVKARDGESGRDAYLQSTRNTNNYKYRQNDGEGDDEGSCLHSRRGMAGKGEIAMLKRARQTKQSIPAPSGCAMTARAKAQRQSSCSRAAGSTCHIAHCSSDAPAAWFPQEYPC